jgi:hypothetical protein|tara:strand:- start:824 stop:1114 length:291 start_codon:yes stop_codon:yes gene_type:complete
MNFDNGIGWTQQAGNEVWIKDCFNPNGLFKNLKIEFNNVFYMATDHRMIVSDPKRFDEHKFTIVNDVCEELESRINCEKSGICPDCKNIVEACYCD